MTRVDVIVLNYNGRHFLNDCLRSLETQTFRDFQVLLVDNGSSDGSADFVREAFPEVRVLPLDRNYGFCGGNNRGIASTDSDYVVLLNNDTVATPTWLAGLVTTLDDPEVGFGACCMVRIADRSTVDTAGDLFFTCGVGGKRGRGQPADQFRTPARVFGACAGAAIYRRSMLQDIGLLDEDFFATDEDVDLSFRAQLRGYKCQYVPTVVYHHVGGSFGPLSGRTVSLVRRNALEVLLKNMPAPLLMKYSLLIAAYFVAGDIYYTLRLRSLAVASARWANLVRLPSTLRKRRAIQARRRLPLRELDRMFQPSGRRFRDIIASGPGT